MALEGLSRSKQLVVERIGVIAMKQLKKITFFMVMNALATLSR